MRPVAVVEVEFESPAESVFDAWIQPRLYFKVFFCSAYVTKCLGKDA